MTISIITINRNSATAAGATIASLRAQSCGFEWIVVDGASDDGSQDLLRAGLREGDRFISEPDAGIADAFNKGIALARGSAVLFLNAGDALVGTDALARLVGAWDAGRQPWVTGGAEVCRADGSVMYRRVHRLGTPAPALLARGCRIWHAATLIDRRLLERHGGYDASYRIAMDYELWLRFAAAREPLAIVPAVLCRFALGGASADLAQRAAEDRRARAAHGMGNPWPGEAALGAIAGAKRWLRPLAGPRLHRIKERLGW